MTYVFNIQCEDKISSLEDSSADLVLTSPPYNIEKEYEKRMPLNEYIAWQSSIISSLYRVISSKGSICWQVGNYISDGKVYPIDCLLFDSFIRAGFIPRNRIVWTFEHGLHCKNRFSGRHETILWFSKTDDYTFNLDPVRVPQKYANKKHYKGPNKGKLSGNPLGKNPTDTWAIPNVKHNHVEKTEHPCQFPFELASRCILALSNENDLVFDPFTGSGTTGAAAISYNRRFMGCEVKKEYTDIANERIKRAEQGTLEFRLF